MRPPWQRAWQRRAPRARAWPTDWGLPVYFYEEAATRPEHRALPAVRGGGFEALRGQDLVAELAPDLGPARIHPTAGAVAVGARGPLIAFNVNLNTPRVEESRVLSPAASASETGAWSACAHWGWNWRRGRWRRFP